MAETFNICEWLLDRNVLEGFGTDTAIRCRGESVTYQDLLDRVSGVAAGLRALGLRPEERVAMIMLDSVEFTAVFLGALRIGAIPVPLNPLLPVRDLAVIIADARARFAVISSEHAGVIGELRQSAPEIAEIVMTESGQADGASVLPWEKVFVGPSGVTPYSTGEESPAFWLCTSGTTGRPKLAMHRHADLRITAETYAREVLSISRDDRFYSVGPMFHAYGLGNSLAFPFSVGATAILEPTRPPTPQLVADITRSERPTLFFGLPTFFAALAAAELPSDTFASVRFAVSAAEALPSEIFTRFREAYGIEILDGIGSTEMMHIFISNRPSEIRPGSSGTVVGGYEVRLLDDGGSEVGSEEPGTLFVRGESAALGYWCRSTETRRTFRGEWVRTGDLYMRSDDGYYTHLGRSDDMLRVGGEWVSPVEVEAALVEHPEVLEAAVVGQRDDRGLEVPVAYVIPRPGATPAREELIEFCRSRLAGFKRPRQIVLVDDLPKTATGKIQRYMLRG